MTTRFFSVEATEQDSDWLNYRLNSDLARQTRHAIKRYAEDLRVEAGTAVFPRLINAHDAVSYAVELSDYKALDAALHRLEAAGNTDDSVREPFCGALPLLMKTPRHPVGPKVLAAHQAFVERLTSKVSLAPGVALRVLAKRLGGDSYERLMRSGLPAREGQTDEDRLPPKGCVELSIVVAPQLVAPLVVPFASELEDAAHFARMDGLVRAAVTPLISGHVEQLRARCVEYGASELNRFETVVVRAERGPVGTQNIGGLLEGAPWKAYAYWGFTKETQGEKAPLTFEEYGWRAGGFDFSMYNPEISLQMREASISAPVACPACGGSATALVSMLPTRKHSGIWKLSCGCGHSEAKSRGDVENLRLSYLECGCATCAPRRARLMEKLRPYRKDLQNRLAGALETAVEAVLDAFAGRNGFQATEDGEIWKDGMFQALYLESVNLPAGGLTRRTSLSEQVDRLRRRLPISLMLEQSHQYTRVIYRKPLGQSQAVRSYAMPKSHLDRFLMGYEDETSFKDWALAAVGFSTAYYVPLPLSVTVWEGRNPPAWLPASLRAQFVGEEM